MASHFNVLCNHCVSELDSIHYLLCTFEVKTLMLISIDRIESILIVTCFRFIEFVVLVSCYKDYVFGSFSHSSNDNL